MPDHMTPPRDEHLIRRQRPRYVEASQRLRKLIATYTTLEPSAADYPNIAEFDDDHAIWATYRDELDTLDRALSQGLVWLESATPDHPLGRKSYTPLPVAAGVETEDPAEIERLRPVAEGAEETHVGP